MARFIAQDTTLNGELYGGNVTAGSGEQPTMTLDTPKAGEVISVGGCHRREALDARGKAPFNAPA
jgi:uncharacterized ParB-like nuclease family protein